TLRAEEDRVDARLEEGLARNLALGFDLEGNVSLVMDSMQLAGARANLVALATDDVALHGRTEAFLAATWTELNQVQARRGAGDAEGLVAALKRAADKIGTFKTTIPELPPK